MPRIARAVVPGEAHRRYPRHVNFRESCGRPRGSEEFVTDVEGCLGRELRPKRPGRKRKGK